MDVKIVIERIQGFVKREIFAWQPNEKIYFEMIQRMSKAAEAVSSIQNESSQAVSVQQYGESVLGSFTLPGENREDQSRNQAKASSISSKQRKYQLRL